MQLTQADLEKQKQDNIEFRKLIGFKDKPEMPPAPVRSKVEYWDVTGYPLYQFTVDDWWLMTDD